MQAAKIVGIKKLSNKKTIDIEVDSDLHVFYGNGIATSNSHAISYGYNSYLSAYCKTHYKQEFFTAYLKYAHNSQKPQQEVYELVNNAKAMDVFIRPPDITKMNAEFDLFGDDILFGLCDVKNVGMSVIEKLEKTVAEVREEIDKDLPEFSWVDLLLYLAPTIKVNSLESLISVGACDCFNKSRTEMLLEATAIRKLSDRELDWVKNNIEVNEKTTLMDILECIVQIPPGRTGACANKNRLAKVEDLIKSVRSPGYSLEDKPHQISMDECGLLGVNITASMLDECETRYKANCSCLEYNQGFGNKGNNVVIATIIDSVRKHKTKNGKNPGQEMAFVEASDETGSIDSVVVFPDYWSEYKNMIVEGNRLLLCGKKNTEKDSFVLELVEQL